MNDAPEIIHAVRECATGIVLIIMLYGSVILIALFGVQGEIRKLRGEKE